MIWIIIAVLLVVFLGLLVLMIHRYQTKKRKNDIARLFVLAAEANNKKEYRLEWMKKEVYDLYFEGDESIYYVKVLDKLTGKEVCINNALKWQIREYGLEQSMHFVEGIEGLMRMDWTPNSSKRQHKLFLIYPNARALLKVINECEMAFIYPDTDVYGTQVINWRLLKDHLEYLDV